jgi:FkbM family methyltransferase
MKAFEVRKDVIEHPLRPPMCRTLSRRTFQFVRFQWWYQILERCRRAYKHSPRFVRNTLRPFRDIAADYYNRLHFNRIVVRTAAQISKDSQFHPGHKIFVDCGFNAGEMLERFVKALPDFLFYGFEINYAYFANRAAELEKRHPNILGLKFSAVCDHEGAANFHIAGQKKGILRAEATTILPYLHKEESTQEGPYEVAAIDFSRWLRDMVARHTEADSCKPFVAVKMDIEGAEYAVLEELVNDGTIALVNDLMVEFHTQQFDQKQRPRYARREANIREALSRFPVQILDWG